jgi:hypothetical protein
LKSQSLYNEYAAFLAVPSDDVVNKALEYVFGRDREFQKFRESSANLAAPKALRVKKPSSGKGGAKRGPKPRLMVAGQA